MVKGTDLGNIVYWIYSLSFIKYQEVCAWWKQMLGINEKAGISWHYNFPLINTFLIAFHLSAHYERSVLL